MDAGNLDVIARNTWKLLARNRVFQIYFFLAFGGIVFFQVMEQSIMSPYPNVYGTFGLSSFFPYVNACLFSFLLIVPLIFVIPLLGKENTKQDSVYYRSESNSEYVWGVSFGYIWGFFLMGCLSCMLSMFIHLFISNSPFDFSIYLFYLFSLILPTIVFSFGLCLFVKCVIGHHLLSLLVLLLCFGVTLFVLKDVRPGLFDITGSTLPNSFSMVTGHPDLLSYLLHRAGYFLAGLGFIQLTVVNFKRLANFPEQRFLRITVAFGFVVIFLGLFVIFFMRNNSRIELRQAYTETDNKYSSFAKGTLSRQSLRFEQQGDRMKVNSYSVVHNRTGGLLRNVVLYLNPGLEVTSFQIDGKDVAFERENQVVIAERQVVPGDSVVLHIEYVGRVDENVCYLDVPQDIIEEDRRTMDLICPFGKRYAFLDKDLTLLIPEVLWYPTTKPAVNVRSPYAMDKDFTCFSLEVVVPEDKTVISQGEKEFNGNVVSFVNEHVLTGISLCIGEFETQTVSIDSVVCELNIFKRASSFFEVIESCKNSSLEEVKRKIEAQMGRSYPFSRFALVESPVAFTSYYRYGQGSSEFVQPELVFLPERFTGQHGFSSKEINLSSDLRYYLSDERVEYFVSWWNMLSLMKSSAPNKLFMSYDRLDDNPYNVSPLFFNYVQSIRTDSCLMMNVLNRMLLNRDVREKYSNLTRLSGTETEAINYLSCHGLDEMLTDRQLDERVKREILSLKSIEFLNYFENKAITLERLQLFLREYMDNHLFQSVDFVKFDSAFAGRFGCEWAEMLPSWFKGDKIPVYLVKDLAVKRVCDDGVTTTTLVEFSIYNDSDVDGLVHLQSSDFPYRITSRPAMEWGRMQQSIDTCFEVRARTGKKVALLVPMSNPFFKLNTNISRNIPRQISFYCKRGEPCVDGYVDGEWPLNREDFLPKKNEIVVDNEDEGFSIVQPSLRLRLYEYFTGKDTLLDKYANAYSFAKLDGRNWLTLVENNAYGLVNRSVVARTGGGEGKTWVEWRTDLDRAGKYELFVHIPEFSGMNIICNNTSSSQYGGQAYTLVFPGTNHEVSINTNDYGWISLGEYESASGESVVILHDTGDPNHIIIGDAVKWVYVDER